MTDFSLYTFFVPMLWGLLLDVLLGDPQGWPHPVRLFGKVIAWCDKAFNRGVHRRRKGTLVAVSLVLLTFGALSLVQVLYLVSPVLLTLVNTLLFYFAIAHRSLIKETSYVEEAVEKGDLPEARRRLGFIVGRDTGALDFHKIRTATLETLAENLSDGVIAPLFFYALGGIPLMYAYKMINTMDSMIGYKSEKYKDFGRFAAVYLDDVANWLPSRLTGWLMVLLPPNKRAIRILKRDHSKHASPNSGYPEAALAGLLDCRFGGPNYYGGRLVDKPYIGTNDRPLSHEDFRTAVRTNHRVLILTVGLVSVLYFSIA
ncbi:MAG: adenosylcobinamide-phosphate synthase CbiB [Porphyromonas sp.]|nr:adenosylcobinamide-phosphate synthase CbiB [Bacteroidales bacterium]MDY3100111.1 adenosylcobinamide-phosphate synthase CbiB [Porphyromonas sp.]